MALIGKTRFPLLSRCWSNHIIPAEMPPSDHQADKHRAYYDENLTTKNEQFFQQFLKKKYSLDACKSPSKNEPWSADEDTRRTGLIAKKLGTFPMWTTGGKRLLTTSCLTIPLEDFLDVKVKQEDNVTYVSAEPTTTGREGKVIDVHSEACALCRLNLKNLSYTDVMILSQFIKRDGSMATYHESKLCSKQYNKVVRLIGQAQRCNLIARPANYLVPGPWHDLNTYLEPNRKRDQPMKVVKKQYWKL